MSLSRFLGSYEYQLSSHIKDQSWINQRKKLLVGVIITLCYQKKSSCARNATNMSSDLYIVIDMDP